jgi:hypothetical protein
MTNTTGTLGEGGTQIILALDLPARRFLDDRQIGANNSA